jgi:phage gp36-like protein
MAYITSTDLTTRVGATLLASLVNDAGAQAAIVSTICTQASDRVDGYLGGRYATPVAASLGYVGMLAMAVAEWMLYARGSGPSVPEKIRQAYEDALRDLRDIAAGRVDLAGAAPVGGSGAGGVPYADSDDAVLSSDSMAEAGW